MHRTKSGDDERWPLTQHLHTYIAKDLALWGASHLLLAFHVRLSSIRDHDLRSRRFRSASRRLTKIKDELLSDALDARLAAAELERYAEDERGFERNACEWRSSDDLPEPHEQLLENLRRTIKDNATALAGAETRLRDGLIVESAVLGTRAGLRQNRAMLLITLAALIIAIASLIVASRAGGADEQRPARLDASCRGALARDCPIGREDKYTLSAPAGSRAPVARQ